MATFEWKVNGARRSVTVAPDATLLSALREQLGLTGTKCGCNEGRCGSCTVLLDGRAFRACLVPAAKVGRREVTTIEGLAAGGKLHPVQQAFLELSAFQCGFCTPGMILRGVALLAETPEPSEAVVKTALEGNLCRCGTYPRIVEAVRLAARGGGRG